MSEPIAVYNQGRGQLSRHESVGAPRVTRTRLLQSGVGLVENLRSAGARPAGDDRGYSPAFQVCLPYRGLFVWHVGDDEVIGDANQVLFVTGGESFHVSQPRAGQYAELIITPNPEILAELAHDSPDRLSRHPLFRRRSRRADLALLRLRARYLHGAAHGNSDVVAAEELVIGLLRAALAVDDRTCDASRPTRRLIGRTKEFLEGRLSDPIRLTDVARAVGASPAYLTDVFRRVEGIPLHRYLTQLRLGRALVELPHSDDLTTLALDLGFSSHSHFTSAFRRAMGCTPSQFRESTRRPVLRATFPA